MADEYARNVAKQVLNGELSPPSRLSIADTFRISTAIVTDSWQRHWDNDHTGRYTYNLIPSVRTKVVFPKKRDIGVSYCRMLLHDTMLKDDSYRTGSSDTPVCECGKGNQTVEHFLLYCDKYHTARCDMMDYMKDTSVCSRHKGSCSISECLLLAPPCDNNISKRDNNIIKEALFEFLNKSDRTI